MYREERAREKGDEGLKQGKRLADRKKVGTILY